MRFMFCFFSGLFRFANLMKTVVVNRKPSVELHPKMVESKHKNNLLTFPVKKGILKGKWSIFFGVDFYFAQPYLITNIAFSWDSWDVFGNFHDLQACIFHSTSPWWCTNMYFVFHKFLLTFTHDFVSYPLSSGRMDRSNKAKTFVISVCEASTPRYFHKNILKM